MREAEIRVIGDTTYELKPLNTSAMLKLMTKLAKILGPSVAVLDNPTQLATLIGAGRVLAELGERFDEADVLAVCAALAEHTLIVDGDKKLRLGGSAGAQWETHFAGDPVGLFRWLGAALEVNFGPLAEWAAQSQATAAPGGAVPAR